MKTILLLALLSLTASSLYAADDTVFYARCNLRTHWHNVSAENWLAYEVGIPVGTRITAKEKVYEYESFGETTTETGLKFVTDAGEAFKFPSGPHDKYLQTEPLDLATLPQDVQTAIITGEPANGMTKDHVFMTMCAPAYVLKGMVTREVVKGEDITLDEIKGYDVWIYQRKRIGKKFWIQFNDQGTVEKMFWGVL